MFSHEGVASAASSSPAEVVALTRDGWAMSECPEGGCGEAWVWRDSIFRGIHPDDPVPVFRILGLPYQHLDLCVTDLPWLRFQTSLEPWD